MEYKEKVTLEMNMLEFGFFTALLTDKIFARSYSPPLKSLAKKSIGLFTQLEKIEPASPMVAAMKQELIDFIKKEDLCSEI